MNAPKTFAAIALLIAAGCFTDPGTGKTKATVSQSASPQVAKPAKSAAPAKERTVRVDRTRSTIAAVGAKVTRKHDISFDDWSGTFQMNGDELTGVAVEIQMASMRADVDKLTGHLKSPDFFDVPTHPTSSFTSTKITKRSGPDNATHLIEGDLTMHGVTRRISFPATVKSAGGDIVTSAEFVIDRQDFGITYPGMPDDLIKDNVALTIDLVGDQPDA